MRNSIEAPLSLKVPALVLMPQFRRDLSLPQGTLYVHPKGGVIRGLKVKVLVGDIVSMTHYANIRVIDHKTKRAKVESTWGDCTHVINPPGSLSLNSLTLASKPEGIICVAGEEDLLVISYIVKDHGDIAYGQPGVGVVVVRPRPEIALKVLKILKPGVVDYTGRG